MINATIISVDKAIKSGRYFWNKNENDVSEFYGNVTGYTTAFCLELKKGEEYNYSSVVFTNNCGAILIPEVDSCFNDLGVMASLCMLNGWEPTGNIIFRGYYKECYDERGEIYYKDASREVEKIINKSYKEH